MVAERGAGDGAFAFGVEETHPRRPGSQRTARSRNHDGAAPLKRALRGADGLQVRREALGLHLR